MKKSIGRIDFNNDLLYSVTRLSKDNCLEGKWNPSPIQ